MDFRLHLPTKKCTSQNLLYFCYKNGCHVIGEAISPNLIFHTIKFACRFFSQANITFSYLRCISCTLKLYSIREKLELNFILFEVMRCTLLALLEQNKIRMTKDEIVVNLIKYMNYYRPHTYSTNISTNYL